MSVNALINWDTYEKKLSEIGYDQESLAVIKPAFEFASKVHINEKRESGEPYIIHPIEVSLYIAHLKLDTQTIVAALLHDVTENQGIEIEKIKQNFGDDVAFLVDALTKVDRIKYKGIERTVESLRKMFLALAEDVRVVLIKLMDRLHNMKTLRYIQPEKKRQRIALETLELYAPLADKLGMWEVKAELEDLAFLHVHPEEYNWVQIQIKERRERAEKYLDSLKPFIEQELKKENVKPIQILHRVKNIYSIWKKVIRYEMNLDLVLDIVSMRIIVESVEDCYQALGVIHKLYKPMPGRIKDYIALPKHNGYQSIHTTVFGPQEHIIDFQIRTATMDEESKHGIAAHWIYKSGDKSSGTKNTKKLSSEKYAWVRQLQEWQSDHADSSDDALNALKIDLFKDRIFVFTPKGDVFDLPEDSTPIDFAYNVHSEIGDHMFGAKVSGKMVPFSHALKSGDTVEIMTQKNKKPTVDWLDYAKTSLAKNRIRSFLRKEEGLDTQYSSKRSHKDKQAMEATITVLNRVGMLKDISAAFSDLGINMGDVKVDTKNTSHPKITIYFQPKKGLPDTKILTRIKKIKDVESITIKKAV